MLAHVILGMMRDGKVWHGYALKKEYRKLSGIEPNEGNFYTKLAQLSDRTLITSVKVSPGGDRSSQLEAGGRVVVQYRITDNGRREFDAWLLSPASLRCEMPSWLLFLNLVPPDTADAMLESEKEQRLHRCKSLAHRLEDERADWRLNGKGYNARALLLARDLSYATTELESLETLRHEIARLREIGVLPR
jgi:DNA-binding PadR family transcriptional regulator